MIIDETTSRPENHCDDVYIYITDTVEPGKFNSMIYVYFYCQLSKFIAQRITAYISIEIGICYVRRAYVIAEKHFMRERLKVKNAN